MENCRLLGDCEAPLRLRLLGTLQPSVDGLRTKKKASEAWAVSLGE